MWGRNVDDRERRVEEAREGLEAEEFERVVVLLERSVRRGEADAEATGLYALALYYLGEEAAAAPHLDAALAEYPEDGEMQLARALVDFHRLETEAAARRLRDLAEVEADLPEAQYWLGRVLDWWSVEKPELATEAEAALRAAERLAPDDYPLPVSFGEAEFQRSLEEAIEGLPEPVMRAAHEVAILVEAYPSRELIEDAGGGLSPDLLGLYTGTPLPERSTWDSGRSPDLIHLFRRNLEFLARTPEELREEIRVTLLHEVGHYLGMDEPDLERLGLE